MSPVRFILSNLDHLRRSYFLFLCIGLVDGAISFALPLLLSEFTKEALTQEDLTTLLFLLVGLLITSRGLQYCIRRWGEALSYHFKTHLLQKLFWQTEELPPQRRTKYHSGYLLSLVQQIAEKSSQLIFDSLWLLAYGFSTLLLFFAITVQESALVAIINGITLLLFLSVSVLLSRRMVPLASTRNRREARFIERTVDFMSNLSSVTKLSVQPFVRAQLSVRQEEADRAADRVQNFHAARWCLLYCTFSMVSR